MLRAVANPAAGGQPGSFTTLTVSGNATIGGNLGVGATLEAWVAGINAVQINARSATWANATTLFVSNNVYTDGTDRRIEAAFATRYYQSGQSHIWEYADTGAADSAIAFGEAMRATPTGLDVTGQIEADTLRVNVTPTAETPSATHTAVFNINGTNYKFLCLAA